MLVLMTADVERGTETNRHAEILQDHTTNHHSQRVLSITCQALGLVG